MKHKLKILCLFPDLALVCIGGWFTMGPVEAAYAKGKPMKPGDGYSHALRNPWIAQGYAGRVYRSPGGVRG